jgi:hypothetical protein
VLTSSEIFIISAIVLILTSLSSFLNSVHEEAYGQLPDLFNNDTYFLDDGEEPMEDDSSEITIPEKGVFERIRNSTRND